MPEPPAATLVTLRRTNTLTLKANTAYQLVTVTPGGCYFSFLNLGPGTLYIRYEAPPELGPRPEGGRDDAFPLPAGTPLTQFYVTGTAGLYVLADATSKVGVLSSLR